MLKDALNLIELISHSINFTSCFLIFLGGGYIALHSRVLPKWAVTCLWYIGLAALLNAITILIEWTIGPLHPFSHFQIGKVTETGVLLMMAIMVGFLFFNTVWQDYLGAKRRKAIEEKLATKKVPRKRTTKSVNRSVPRKVNSNSLEL